MVVVFVSLWHWPPLVANIPAWMLALLVSFTGHHRFTFRDHHAPVAASALRFFLVSAAGFAINEATYALLLRWSAQRYDVLLAGVLSGVAIATYLLSRHWAFLRNPAP